MVTLKNEFDLLTSQQKEALSYLGKNPHALQAILSLVEDELTLAKDQYELSKDALVATGEGRPACLHHRGRIAACETILRKFNSFLTIGD